MQNPRPAENGADHEPEFFSRLPLQPTDGVQKCADEKSGMKLYVDDVRTPPPGWTVARTVKEAIDVLDAGGVVEVSLDYFIGDGEGGTFLPVAHHISEMDPSLRPKHIHFHTASAAGAARMADVLGQT